MMTLFRDKQVRLAMLLLYGLAALCLSLAHAERIVADPGLDRVDYCLSTGDAAASGGWSDCGPCGETAGADPAFLFGDGFEQSLEKPASWAVSAFAGRRAGPFYPLGSRAPPAGS